MCECKHTHIQGLERGKAALQHSPCMYLSAWEPHNGSVAGQPPFLRSCSDLTSSFDRAHSAAVQNHLYFMSYYTTTYPVDDLKKTKV